MQLGKQIHARRQRLGLTQDALAAKLYVSRQTVSNWENDRNYPDIENLLLLSVLFDVSLDDLVKGDVTRMKQKISQAGMTRDAHLMLGFMLAAIVSIGPSLFLPGYWWLVAPVILWGISMGAALHLEHLKRVLNVRTYREIKALMEGTDVAAVRQRRNRRRDSLTKAGIVLIFGAACGVLTLLAALPFWLWG